MIGLRKFVGIRNIYINYSQNNSIQKKIDKSVEVKETYEIKEIKVKNGMVYLKISSKDGSYKWIKYCTANNDSKEVLEK